uniref:hypothetical protein n=1 Tax=Streptococcus suis TaxID=1307 RepID=UPI00128FDE9B
MKKNYTLKTIAVLTLGTIAFTGLTAQAEDIYTQPVNEYMKLKYWYVETGLPKTAEEIATMEGISLEEAEKIVEELKALQASS